jgi:hypothetical protein
MKCRYAPKYASQYKSKHTKHVKLSKKARFPLDAQKEYPNHEWPPLKREIQLTKDIFKSTIYIHNYYANYIS